MIVAIGQEGSGTSMLIEIICQLGFTTHPYREDLAIHAFLGSITGTGFSVDKYVSVSEEKKVQFSKIMKDLQYQAWKVPRFIAFWKDLANLIPNPKFVVIVRDFDDVVRSQVNKLGVTEERAIDNVNSRASMVEEFTEANECLVTHYEDFLRNPEDAVRVVSDYIRADQSNIPKAARIIKI